MGEVQKWGRGDVQVFPYSRYASKDLTYAGTLDSGRNLCAMRGGEEAKKHCLAAHLEIADGDAPGGLIELSWCVEGVPVCGFTEERGDV
jgi:hypothetical protein